MNESKIVTRFAPSPTGNLHCGTVRTAIFSYLVARKNNGKFILRIEDTDKERSTKEYEENILESLTWLGLEHDEFFRQSDNAARHKAVLEQLVADGHAYISKEEAKDGSGVIKEIVRFKNPNIDVTFHDEIKGIVTMHTEDLGDFVIAKNMHEPLFHLAVVVDDFDEGVTHVIRGEDHVSNTPRQILIQRAIGAPTPIYAHLPLVLGADKQKLSKRKGALAVTEYCDQGFLPEALLNMVSMVGWNPGTDQELFSEAELIDAFDLTKVQKSPAVFNQEKLDWFNREYIKKLDQREFWDRAQVYMNGSIAEDAMRMDGGDSGDMLKKIEPLIRERMVKFSDMRSFFGARDGSSIGEFDYFFVEPKVDPSMLPWKGTDLAEAKIHLSKIIELLMSFHTSSNAWTAAEIKTAVMPYAETVGKGNALWPFRVALSGREKSPDPFELAAILGKEKTCARLERALGI